VGQCHIYEILKGARTQEVGFAGRGWLERGAEQARSRGLRQQLARIEQILRIEDRLDSAQEGELGFRAGEVEGVFF
jgi:hypothetical protein